MTNTRRELKTNIMGIVQNVIAGTAFALVSTIGFFANPAVIQFETNVVDLGEIEHNVPATVEFEFTNEGEEALIITNARASCGCTVADFPRTPIQPGETGVIKAVYNARALGRFSKNVTVTSNASNASLVLTLKGEVKE